MKKYIAFFTVLVAAAILASCQVPMYEDDMPEFNFSSFSRYALERRVQNLATDRQKSIERFYDYNGGNLKRQIMLFMAARNVLLEIRSCYNELDSIRSAYDADYDKYKADPEYEKKLKGVNYYAMILQSDQTLGELHKHNPRVLEARRAAREYRISISGSR